MPLHIEMEIPDDRAAIAAAVEGLAALNGVIMDAAPPFPPLYESGVVYRPEPRGQDDWKHIARLFADGEGDCEDLAAARVAELRRGGELLARVDVVTTEQPGKFHAVVRRGSGELEDPTRILLGKEASTMKRKPKFAINRVGDHCVGSIELPMAGGKSLRCTELGFDAWGALTKALETVVKVASNPAVAALLGPEASVAMTAAAKIAGMSTPALKKLIADDRASEAERKLAAKILQAKQEAALAKQESDLMAHGHESAGWIGASATEVVRDNRRVNVKGEIIHPQVPGAPPPAAAPGQDYTPTRPVSGMPMPGQIDPSTGLVWVADATGGHWERPRSGPAPGSMDPSQPYNPGFPAAPYPGFPPMIPGYPPPGGYPPGTYPPIMAPYPPQYPAPPGYDPYGYPQMTQPWPGYPPPPGYPYAMPPYYPAYPPTLPPGWETLPQPQPLSADEAAAIALWGSGAFAQGAFPGYEQGSPGGW